MLGSKPPKSTIKYASNDVLYLHKIKKELDIILEREKRVHLLSPTLKFLPTRVKLDLQGWDDSDIFSHS